MSLSDKTPVRLVQISLFFSVANFIINGINSAEILLFLVFTLSVYVSTRLFILLETISSTRLSDVDEFKFYLGVAAVLFIGIATFAYSWLFGAYYAFVFGVYWISPYDREWIAGRSKLVVFDNKVEYQKTEA